VYVLWAIMFFDLNYFFAMKVAAPLGRIANYFFVILLVFIAFRALTTSTKRWFWYPPLLLLLFASVGSFPVVANTFIAWQGIQTVLSYCVLAVATAMYVRSPQASVPIIAMMGVRFLWWAMWGGTNGRVGWDPYTNNPDDFGGLMVQGAALCFWFGLAARVRWQRWLMFALSLYSILGVVSSLARGAFLALVAVTLVVWLRSHRKLATGAGILAGVLVVVLAANILVDSGAQAQVRRDRSGTFWEMIMSTFEEGTESGTGAHRMSLWTAAVKVWQSHPVFGVGPGNFGVYASQFFQPGEIEGFENPAIFWGLNVHSAYFQILSEFGVVGAAAFIWLMVDFVRKNRALRRPDAIARWAALGMSDKLDLRSLSLALESAVLAIALVNAIYSAFLQPWWFTLWVLNRTLWGLACAPAESRHATMRFMRRGSVRQRRLTA